MTARKNNNRKPKSSRARNQRLARKQANSLSFERLEAKNLLAAITVSNATDLSNAPDTSSITSLMADDGGDGISLREAITAANNTTGEDSITFDENIFTGGFNNLIRLTQGELEIRESLSINGTSVGTVVITGDTNNDDVTANGSYITDVSASFGGNAGAVDDLLDDNSRVLYFSASAGNLSLTNLQITGGRTSNSRQGGGGIRFNSNGDLTLNSSSASGNSAAGNESPGGGIYTRRGSIFLNDSSVHGNSTSGNGFSNFGDGSSGGGGIYNRFGSVSLTDSSITQNSTSGYYSRGAGIDSGGGSITLYNSVVTNNSTTGSRSGGGGINSFYGDISVSNSTVSGNSTTGYLSEGGGIRSIGTSDILLLNSTVSGNSTAGVGGSGGGISAGLGSLSLHNSTVSGNSTTNDVYSNGGGIFSFYSSVRIVNSTVAENSSASVGGGIGFFSREFNGSDDQGLTLTNSIVAGNTDNGTAPDLLAPRDFPDDLIVNYSLISDTTGSGITATTGTGNLLNQSAMLAPLSDNSGPTQTHALLSGSPAIDSGSDALAVDVNGIALSTDQRGGTSTRSFDDPSAPGTGVDIGAFELHALLVDNQSDEDDGDESVGDLSLREAIRLVNGDPTLDTISFDPNVFVGGTNNVIRLTQGTLVSNESLSIDGTSVGGVVITGDVNGDDATVPGTYTTDVSASFNVYYEGGNALRDNSKVLGFYNLEGNLTLSDLTITGGRAANLSGGGGIDFQSDGVLTLNQSSVSGNIALLARGQGGGIRTDSGSVSLNNSTVSGNRTSGRGGGIYSTSGSISLSNSTVSGNSTAGSPGDGGGIATLSGMVSLTNSAVSENTTTRSNGRGGGLFSDTGSISLIDSTVTGNSTTGYRSEGGGIFTNVGNLSLSNSSVVGNSTAGYRSGGGGVASLNGNSTFRDSTVSENSTAAFRSAGGGILTTYISGESAGTLSLYNSTVSGNSTLSDFSGGGGIFAAESRILLRNSTVSGNSTANDGFSPGGGIFSSGAPIEISNSTVSENYSATAGGGISFFDNPAFEAENPRRLTVNSSIVAENTDNGTAPDLLVPSDVQTDLIVEGSLVGDVTGSGITATTGSGNILNLSALLAPLADNGGPTQTHALLPGSPAIDAGNNALAAGLITDQRGSGFVRVEAGTVDIGSFEQQSVQTAGQFVFYNNSSFDNANDADAIATDKVALRNGETATFENYTSYIHGINGIAVDLFNPTNLSGSDIQLKFGNADDVATFATLDSASTITNLTTVAGAGVNGSDRVFIEFADGAITNGWLQVTVLANNNTGLTVDDVFYFGNAIGESGNSIGNATVNISDISGARTNQTGFRLTDLLNVFDFNRDARVNVADVAIARTNQSGFTPIRLITPTDSSVGPSNKQPPMAASAATASVALPVSISKLDVESPEVLTHDIATLNFSSLAVAAIKKTTDSDQSEPDEGPQLDALALVGANLGIENAQENALDRVFEITERENDPSTTVQLADVDSIFESGFSVDF